ncbi:hypothetical protein, partial [Haloechinothrix sp. LS1_15]|uniref:hypothetical protein n=2 Tax=Haloechinothrix sp. LS1_15 TaxID=2652248 RepID=UPI00294B04F4
VETAFIPAKPPRKYRPRMGAVKALGMIAIALYTTAHVVTMKRVHVDAWPICPECEERGYRFGRAARWLFFGGLALFAGPLLFAFTVGPFLPEPTGPRSDLISVLLGILIVGLPIVGFASMIVSGHVYARSKWTSVAGGRVSEDEKWVVFDEPHPNFVAEVQPFLGGARPGTASDGAVSEDG